MRDLHTCKRILVVGAGGAGKSTFAVQLAERTGLPLIHLDCEYWQPGWVSTPEAEWTARVQQLVGGERWVMDGNYGGTIHLRVPHADAIVFFDLPRLVCIWGAIKRVVLQRVQPRYGLAAGCKDRVSLEFLSWIWNFRTKGRPRILGAIENAAPGALVIRVTSRAQARTLLDAAIPQ